MRLSVASTTYHYEANQGINQVSPGHLYNQMSLYQPAS